MLNCTIKQYDMRIAVLTGAGVSAESGLGTYRDNGGLWDNYDPMEVASIEGWRRNPKLVLDFYNMQRRNLEKTQPNAAHIALARLQEKHQVCVITQNVDNLHEKAGSRNVIHLHGEVTKVRPEDSCCDRDCFSEKLVRDIGYGSVSYGDMDERGVQLRPHIVFFGESVPKLSDAAAEIMRADVLIIIGTSMSVYPAASLYEYAGAHTPIYIIDPKDVQIHDPRFIHIKATATQGMAHWEKVMQVNPELVRYVEKSIIPRYSEFDKGHREDHVRAVIEQALYLASFYGCGRDKTATAGKDAPFIPVNADMIYAAAAFHDTGLCVSRETHHLESGRIIREDRELGKWFSRSEIEIIADAAEDHRASSDHEPRTLYGKIIAEADRQIIPHTVIKRTLQYSLAHYPQLDKEGHWRRTLEHMHEKYAEGGYLKLWIPESPNSARMEELRAIIRDEKHLREIFESFWGNI